MAEQLRNHYGAEIPRRIATMISAVHPAFPAKRFLTTALAGYDELNLMARGRQIAAALALHLPEDFDAAADILLASLGPRPRSQEGEGGMASFLYLPHTLFVASHGLDHFETSMRAQYELTQRFTAEFSMRPFLERHEQATLARLAEWAGDANEHVRRLVSEATRPRLPWAARLRRFQRDPRPVLALLELLKDDPSLYVRRSVANNLNDIGKDKPDVEVMDVAITPARATIGGAVSIGFTLRNTRRKPQQLLVDFRIHYRKANGKSSPPALSRQARSGSRGQRRHVYAGLVQPARLNRRCAPRPTQSRPSTLSLPPHSRSRSHAEPVAPSEDPPHRRSLPAGRAAGALSAGTRTAAAVEAAHRQTCRRAR